MLAAQRLSSTQRWSQRRLRRSVFAADFGLADVPGGVAQLLVVRAALMSDTGAASSKSQINVGRIIALTVIAAFGGFLLYAFVCDFPPFESETLPERFCAVASAVVSWPVIVVARDVPDSTAGILALPAFVLSGLFWAALIELLVARYARRP